MRAPRVAVLVLAAGRSSRMGGPNKLLATFEGRSLIRRSVETARASAGSSVFVVLGHESAQLRAELEGLAVEIVENPSFADGMSTSLRLGFEQAASQAEGVLVMLADQPGLEPVHLDALIGAFRPSGDGSIVVATARGMRGNPVVLSSLFARDVRNITGDKGARVLVARNADVVREVEIGPAALLDVDTPDRLHAAGGVLPDALPRRS